MPRTGRRKPKTLAGSVLLIQIRSPDVRAGSAARRAKSFLYCSRVGSVYVSFALGFRSVQLIGAGFLQLVAVVSSTSWPL